MRLTTLSRTAALVVALFGSLEARAVSPENQPGLMSRVELWSDGPCLEAGFPSGVVRNICADRSITVFFPLIMQNDGTPTVKVFAWGPSKTSDVTCDLFTQNYTGSASASSFGTLTLPRSGGTTPQVITWGPRGYSTARTLYVRCKLAFDGRVFGIQYNQ
jgi:hypothetical protein